MEADPIKKTIRTCWSVATQTKTLQSDDGFELFARKSLVDMFRGEPFPVRVGDAGVKGRGVFTTRPAKEGQVLTLYPCHMLLVRAPGHQPKFVSSRPLTVTESASLTDYGHRLCEAADGTAYEAIGDPAHEFEAHACGHMINDPHPAVHTINACPSSPEDAWKSVLDYEQRVAGPANCDLEPFGGICTLCVATRDIAEGEEVLAPYGLPYWCKLEAPQIMKMFLEHGDRLKRENPSQFQAACSIVKRFITKPLPM
jgi:hypothetical protein